MSLLKSLNTALSKVYGNTMLIEDDRGYDEFYCPTCKNRVYEDQYNHKHGVCFKCWYDATEDL